MDMEIGLFELILSLSFVVETVSSEVYNHHKRVTYIAFRIAEEMEIKRDEQINVAIVAAVHDIGVL